MARTQTGESLKNNYAATAAPTVNDDLTLGYSVGSRWIDVTNDEIYICTDNSDGAAVWVQSSVGTAAEVVFTPAGNLSANDVQEAIEELDTEKQAAGNYFDKSTDDSDDITEGTTTKMFLATERTKLAGIEPAADVTDAGNVGSSIHGATGKTTPVDADTMPIIDTEASNVLKKLTFTNLKAFLKTYFDTLYQAAGGGSFAAKVITGTRTASTAAGDQTIAHGLGKTPSLVLISAKMSDGTTTGMTAWSDGSYDGSSNKCSHMTVERSGGQFVSTPVSGVNTTKAVDIAENNSKSNRSYATIAVDGTNVTLSWTKDGSPDGDIAFVITVMG